MKTIPKRLDPTWDRKLNFADVKKEEIEAICAARKQLASPRMNNRDEDTPQKLSALCLSGGGIRSATFALGCLQALDKKRLIQQFDYLSTVSGGGYIGSWLMALLHRLRPKMIGENTEILETVAIREDEVAGREIDRNKIEPAAIQFLRENSN